jgi:hypothetical protein
MPDQDSSTTTTNGPVQPVTFQSPPDKPADSATDSTGDDGGDDADLGDAGKKALRAERIKARAEAKRRQELEAELATLRASTTTKADTDASVDPKAIAEAAKAEARAEVLKDRVVDKIEVLASKTFANPDIARRLLESSADEFVTGGRVDTDAIKDALAELLEANPGLSVTPAKRFQGTADQGMRGSAKPADLDTQIAAAAAAGNVREQLRLQNLKLLPAITKMVTGLSS